MKTLVHGLTGVLLASLLMTGCGAHAVPGAMAARSTTLAARSAKTLMTARKPLKAVNPASVAKLLSVGQKLQQSHVNLNQLSMQAAEDSAAPAGDAKPLPAPQPKEDEVNALLDLLSANGYGGDRNHMVQSIHDAVYRYVLEDTDPTSPYYAPRGWDPQEYTRIATHYCYWLPNFSIPVNSPDDYASQAYMIAQSRIDVKYYVWVSKPADGFWKTQQDWQDQTNACPAGPAPTPDNHNPFANVSNYAPIYTDATGFNIVKAVGDNGWMVNVGTTALPSGQKVGRIEDYFEMPARFIDPVDLGNLLPIPEELYY